MKLRKDYGKSIKWPSCAKSLAKADTMIRKIYIRWRAYMILKPYSPKIRAEIYLLSLCFEIIKNRPIATNMVQNWKGDYLADVNN